MEVQNRINEGIGSKRRKGDAVKDTDEKREIGTKDGKDRGKPDQAKRKANPTDLKAERHVKGRSKKPKFEAHGNKEPKRVANSSGLGTPPESPERENTEEPRVKEEKDSTDPSVDTGKEEPQDAPTQTNQAKVGEVGEALNDNSDEEVETPRAPPAAYEFDLAPAPPQKLSSISGLWTSPLSQEGALRRSEFDARLAAETFPISWVKEDDPNVDDKVCIRGTLFDIPKLFDEDESCKAMEREAEKAELKFRSARRERSVGGEIGTIIIKKKPVKVKKPPPPPSKPKKPKKDVKKAHPSKPKEPKVQKSEKAEKKEKAGKLDKAEKQEKKEKLEKPEKPKPTSKKQTKTAGGKAAPVKPKAPKKKPKPKQATPEGGSEAKPAKEKKPTKGKKVEAKPKKETSKREFDKKLKPIWRTIVKTDVPKAYRAMTAQSALNARQCRVVSLACSKEVRRRAVKLMKPGDDAIRRSRRLVKDVLAYWKREEKERAEEIKRVNLEMEIQRKKEEEEREAQRQKNKLKFLLGQSEAFSSFLQKKAKATAAAADGKGFEDIDGTETDADIQRRAEAEALLMVKDHREKLDIYDKQMRKVRNEANGLVASDVEKKKDSDKSRVAVTQPSILIGKMKEYQLRGLSWLVSLYDQGINGILADEMGLGKTIQTISFLAYLAEKENNWGPFLVVTPKATLHNWQQEITKFCPSFRVLPYWGSKNDRQELRKHWSAKRMYHKDAEFHVCITSYETLTSDERHFPRVKWQYLVLDEAQAIKNSTTSRWKTLLNFSCRNRLLLTGTPLQNKMAELWSLLHFIMPSIFDSHEEFTAWFAKDIEGHARNNSLLDSETVQRLRTLLDPFMLRRVKRDVENEMPPKTEVELPCELTPRQRVLYSAIKSNISVEELLRSMGGTADKNSEDRGQLMNIVMQLRKVCNHPETFERRHAGTPYQFQGPRPPPHLPLPPTILSTGVRPIQNVTLVTRSAIQQSLPRLVEDLEEDLRNEDAFWSEKLCIWLPTRTRDSLLDGSQSAVRLCGYSGSELYRTMVKWDRMKTWWWMLRSQTERLVRHWETFSECRSSEMLLEPFVKNLANSRSILLPGRESPVALCAINSRLLRTTRVYVPPSASPAIEPFVFGSTARNRHLRETRKFLYPKLNAKQSIMSTKEWYEMWRGLFGEYGLYYDSAPIMLPDPGRLVADSGKMKLLDTLLRKLKVEGHKCLVYSQFTRVLDILEDYCAVSSYKFLRLDGQSALADRRDMVADWQSNDELFIFLLSTRAGGVGINLTAADTVIFYDSDWNPTVDAQAMDRAHRLGQERPVTVFRLISQGTVEERIRARARQKDRIHDLVIRGGSLDAVEARARDAELSDVATLLLGEEDINMKAMLAGGNKVKRPIESEEDLLNRLMSLTARTEKAEKTVKTEEVEDVEAAVGNEQTSSIEQVKTTYRNDKAEAEQVAKTSTPEPDRTEPERAVVAES
uniref:Chromatin-remodeling ATPase INO80 n=2 Tax=Rhodosorus marinus TaxID=101924 RepID=A0A7S3EE99_9RHOD|mmetsp:Transcript_29263/g.113477  ORF Transcript_29263/g.113477 Transcript_29263/m.113477 type:complete len:1462 (+) Transcript_29263:270-4655(+)|eukprot:CAMPEP_0113958218 /NCGR_PEP_ID=MMETSP0011_2-20120614/3260_1 /TAXON_ID=101924 /ORGANISM="Rhodosorus marinus" /LENGTH=1461 /DNA_ID=CAMNT_0000968981 /DNA_START=187 /DNA_END=4572 /DNA_ORIENTATION=- /assembly_acc=CAM_ASM_000156